MTEQDPDLTKSPQTIDLAPLRELVRTHLLVEELDACLKHAKKDEAALELLADEQLARAQTKTFPVSAEQPALRVVALAAGRLFISVDMPGMDREDFDAATLNDLLQEKVISALGELPVGDRELIDLVGRNHQRPMNVTSAQVLEVPRREGFESEDGCRALREAGFEALVKENYNAVSLRSAVLELLGQLHEVETELAAGDPAVERLDEKASLVARLAALRKVFDLKNRTDVRVTRAGSKESASSRAARTLRSV